MADGSPPGKQPRVAVLTLVSAADEIGRIAAFMAGMRELGYVAGQTFVIDYRYANGEPVRLGPLAHELIALASACPSPRPTSGRKCSLTCGV